MKKSVSEHTKYLKKWPVGLFLLAGLLTLALLVPQIGAHDKEAAGCPYLSQASSQPCPYTAHGKGTGCPHMEAMKGSGCPYLAESKGCLHALKYSLKLDEKQAESLKQVQEEFMLESAELKTGIQETRSALDAMFRDPDVSADEIVTKRNKLAGMREELERMATDLRLEIREDLTEEQLRSIPEGCWHGILAYGYGDVWSGHHGCNCPYMQNPSDVSA